MQPEFNPDINILQTNILLARYLGQAISQQSRSATKSIKKHREPLLPKGVYRCTVSDSTYFLVSLGRDDKGKQQYDEFHDFEHMLILGRVMTGTGGTLLLAKAGEVLRQEFPGLTEPVRLHVPDEKSRRVGQAAAASLLAISRQE